MYTTLLLLAKKWHTFGHGRSHWSAKTKTFVSNQFTSETKFQRIRYFTTHFFVHSHHPQRLQPLNTKTNLREIDVSFLFGITETSYHRIVYSEKIRLCIQKTTDKRFCVICVKCAGNFSTEFNTSASKIWFESSRHWHNN